MFRPAVLASYEAAFPGAGGFTAFVKFGVLDVGDLADHLEKYEDLSHELDAWGFAGLHFMDKSNYSDSYLMEVRRSGECNRNTTSKCLTATIKPNRRAPVLLCGDNEKQVLDTYKTASHEVNRAENWAAQIHKLTLCGRLVESYEISIAPNYRFRWFIKLRTDLLMLEPFPFLPFDGQVEKGEGAKATQVNHLALGRCVSPLNCGHGKALCKGPPNYAFIDHLFVCPREAADGFLKHMGEANLKCLVPSFGYGYSPRTASERILGTMTVSKSHAIFNDGTGGGEEMWPMRWAYMLYRRYNKKDQIQCSRLRCCSESGTTSCPKTCDLYYQHLDALGIKCESLNKYLAEHSSAHKRAEYHDSVAATMRHFVSSSPSSPFVRLNASNLTVDIAKELEVDTKDGAEISRLTSEENATSSQDTHLDPHVAAKLVLTPADPPHPNCTESNVKSLFALALYGSVSASAKNGGNLAHAPKRATAKGGYAYTDLPAEAFIDVTRVHASLQSHLLRSSGGEARFHVFMHSWVQSTEVQGKLLQSYHPIAARFDNEYSEIWGPGFAASSALHGMTFPEVSRITSASRALRLVREAEEAKGKGGTFRYAKVYLARPDVELWRAIDLRRYCGDVFYINNQCPPFHKHQKGSASGCWGDFHYVMTSDMAAAFSTIADHLTPGLSLVHGSLERFLATALPGVRLAPDHIVAGRHEEVIRKIALRKKHYLSCCSCATGCDSSTIPQLSTCNRPESAAGHCLDVSGRGAG